jgi:hypothetical protein
MKRTTALICLIVVIFTFSANSQVKLPTSLYKHFEGSISIKNPATEKIVELPLKMNFRKMGTKITGTYYHTRDSVNYSFSGEIKSNNSFEAQVFDFSYYLMGAITGTFTTENELKCTFEDVEKTKKIPMHLKESYTTSVEFKIFGLSDVYYIQNNQNFPSVSTKLDYLHPVAYKNKLIVANLAASIENKFFGDLALKGDPSGNIQKKRNEDFNDYKALIEKNFVNDKERFMAYIWKAAYEADIVFNDDSLLTFQINGLDDRGGTGSGGINYYCYELKKGNQIKKSDIFKPNFDKPLTAMIIKKIREWNDLSETENLEELGFQVDLIVPNDNFYIDRTGVGFYYNPFEIFDSESRIYFTFQEIATFLKPQSPISHLYPKNIDFTKNMKRKFTSVVKKEIKKKDDDDDEGEVKY